MVLGYHLIFTGYGWWLPNDPRGSSSHEIRNDLIAELGELHHGRKRVQPNGESIRTFYDQARRVLKHELRTFDDAAHKTIASAFSSVIQERQYTCYACAIMPDHVHVLIRKHRDKAEEMIVALQRASGEELIQEGMWLQDHPIWGGPGWKVFLDTTDDIRRTIHYIKRNPVPYGLPVQEYTFVTEYDGWDLGGAAR